VSVSYIVSEIAGKESTTLFLKLQKKKTKPYSNRQRIKMMLQIVAIKIKRQSYPCNRPWRTTGL
jgi:hypothetical protein